MKNQMMKLCGNEDEEMMHFNIHPPAKKILLTRRKLRTSERAWLHSFWKIHS
ncbi:Lipase member K [Clarias magur]|uniref:Lipase member K n=1 Tax=Clarias magur TaxID=1594786 RepID=A0A8J4X0G7_CLAMG|nr:Lipase member K [Clarias magur]